MSGDGTSVHPLVASAAALADSAKGNGDRPTVSALSAFLVEMLAEGRWCDVVSAASTALLQHSSTNTPPPPTPALLAIAREQLSCANEFLEKEDGEVYQRYCNATERLNGILGVSSKGKSEGTAKATYTAMKALLSKEDGSKAAAVFMKKKEPVLQRASPSFREMLAEREKETKEKQIDLVNQKIALRSKLSLQEQLSRHYCASRGILRVELRSVNRVLPLITTLLSLYPPLCTRAESEDRLFVLSCKLKMEQRKKVISSDMNVVEGIQKGCDDVLVLSETERVLKRSVDAETKEEKERQAALPSSLCPFSILPTLKKVAKGDVVGTSNFATTKTALDRFAETEKELSNRAARTPLEQYDSTDLSPISWIEEMLALIGAPETPSPPPLPAEERVFELYHLRGRSGKGFPCVEGEEEEEEEEGKGVSSLVLACEVFGCLREAYVNRVHLHGVCCIAGAVCVSVVRSSRAAQRLVVVRKKGEGGDALPSLMANVHRNVIKQIVANSVVKASPAKRQRSSLGARDAFLKERQEQIMQALKKQGV